MNMDIKYEGCTAQPNDYLSEDGQLDAALDLVPRNGVLKPFVQPASAGSYTISASIKLYVHQTAEYTHYILVNDSQGSGVNLSWIASLDDTDYTLIKRISSCSFVGIAFIGNTIVMTTDTQLAYCIWKSDEEAYVYLGDRVPDPEIQFALRSHLITKEYESSNMTSTSDVSSSTTADEAWEDVATATASGTATSTSGSYIEATFDDDLTIEAGTQYRIRVRFITGKFEGAGAVWGYNSSGTQKAIFGFTKASSSLVFSTSEDYTGISVRILTYRTSVTTSFRAYIQSGAEAVTGRAVEYTEETYNAVMGCINKFVQDEGPGKGRFIHPFFVRYAVRLYDGSYSYVSPPALMLPNTAYAPFVFFYYGASSGEPRLAAFSADLQYKILGEIGDEWEDVIAGVDVYVSQPIYPYDQGEEYDESVSLFSYIQYNSSHNTVEGYNYTLGSVYAGAIDISDLVEDAYGSTVAGHRKKDLFLYLKEYSGYFSELTSDGRWNIVQAARYDDEELEKKYKGVSVFYMIRQMTLDEMNETADADDDGFVAIDLSEGKLSSLTAQTALSEDTIALTAVTGAGLYAYNNRLHIYNASTKYEEVAHPVRLNSYLNPFSSSENGTTYDSYRIDEAWVYIKTSQGDRCAAVEFDDTGLYRPDCFLWFFYSDTRAYKLVVYSTYCYYSDDDAYILSNTYYQEIPLKMHDFLNGAYAFAMPGAGLSLHDAGEMLDSAPSDVPDDTLLRASTIYVSEPSNPFAFTATSAVSIGAERVYALAAAARALSQGQFGQFPLYAFTSEGVWALETSDTGVYVARQPITRDVCTNTDSITQLDSSVLFVTEKGVMELAGSQSQCISEAIDNHNENTVIASLQGIDTLLGLVGLETASMTVQPFREYIQGCGMVYDSANARVFIFNTDYSYTYVIDMKSMHWSFVSTLIKSGTNSYPEALAVLQDGSVVNFSEEEDTDYVACALLTRPVKFGAPDTLKTVRAVIQRGMFPLSIRSTEETPDNPPVRQALYGSRDLLNWHLVGSSRNHIIRGISGSGYKYFRIAAVFYLQPTDCVAGFTAEAFPRQTNTIR